MRLVLDANVLFAAAWSPDGRAAALFALAARDRAVLVSSPHALFEARRNIALKKPAAADRLENLVELVEIVPEPGPRLVGRAAEAGLPRDDAPILAAAIAASADLLVTGDRTHFGHLLGQRFGPTRVASLAEALSAIL